MRKLFMAVCCVALLLSSGAAFAEDDGDDQTPEQKKLMQTIEEREKIAVQERREPITESPEDDLMYAKEKDRASRISEEEPRGPEEVHFNWY